MYLADQRVITRARPSAVQAAGFEVVMLGHCGGLADFSQLREEAIVQISSLGLVKEAAGLRQMKAAEQVVDQADVDQRLAHLYHLPVPIVSLADFQALFPEAANWQAAYKSQLAGDHFWLPKAVADFFSENQLPTGAKKLWLIRVDEAEKQNGFLPQLQTSLMDTSQLRGLQLALLPPDAGLICMPDLERLQIAQQLADIPRVRLANPAPAFLPCSQKQPADDGHRERRYSEEIPGSIAPWSTRKIIAHTIAPIHKHRPDMQCLWTLPMEYQNSRETPALSSGALDDLKTLAKENRYSRGLHRIQFLFPYLKNRNHLYSASGLLAGRIATQSISAGSWRSIAGIPLPDDSLPYPEVNYRIAAQLRESHGLGMIVRQAGRTYLDDERLASAYTPKYGQTWRDTTAQRSGEFVRFMGFLQRQLSRLGESVLFSLDPLDPRPVLLLEQFFNRLHRLGALRGRSARQAYSIEQVTSSESTLKYEIQISPAFPVDRIYLSFSQRDNENSFALKWEGF